MNSQSYFSSYNSFDEVIDDYIDEKYEDEDFDRMEDDLFKDQPKRSIIDFSHPFKLLEHKREQRKIFSTLSKNKKRSLEAEKFNKSDNKHVDDLIAIGMKFLSSGSKEPIKPFLLEDIEIEKNEVQVEATDEAIYNSHPCYQPNERKEILDEKVDLIIEKFKESEDTAIDDIRVNFEIGKNDINDISKEIIDSAFLDLFQDKKKRKHSIEECFKILNNDKKLFELLMRKGKEKFLMMIEDEKKRGFADQYFSEKYKILKGDSQIIKDFIEFVKKEKNYKYDLFDLLKIKIVYIPSGGCKTSIFKDNNRYLDVDEVIKDNIASFKEINDFLKRHKYRSEIWFRYIMHCKYKQYINRVWIFNNREQIPYAFRMIINEICIIPKVFHFRCKWFHFNLYQLLGYSNLKTYFVKFSDYKLLIDILFFDKGLQAKEIQHMQPKIYNIEGKLKTEEIQDVRDIGFIKVNDSLKRIKKYHEI